MRIITDLNSIKLNNTCITVGKFDGLHLGHQRLFEKMDELCKGASVPCENAVVSCGAVLKKVVVTFDATPRRNAEDVNRDYLLSESEKRKLCEKFGADIYVCIPVSRDFLDMLPETFISGVLADKFGARYIVTGEDFRFGKDRSGDSRTISALSKRYGYEAVVVPQAEYDGEKISSSRIKTAVREGRMDEAAHMLGYTYSFSGTVEHGRQIGRGMHIPTANIIPDTDKVMPPSGVYRTVVAAEDGREFNAISNIGVNPTVTDKKQIRLESHIFDFSGEIYGKDIEVKMLKFVRPEMKFSSVDELRRQIEADIRECRSGGNR